MDITRLYSRIFIGSVPPSAAELRQAGIDVLVLCAMEYQPPHSAFPGIRVIHAPMTDDSNPQNFDIAGIAAQAAALEWRRGRTVLVTCLMGRNRSALVSVLLMKILLGTPTDRLIDFVRSLRRDPLGVPALTNRTFEQFLLRIP